MRVEGSEVTSSEYALTSWLPHAESASPTALFARAGAGAATLSAMIDRLVQKGREPIWAEAREFRGPWLVRSGGVEPALMRPCLRDGSAMSP